MNNLIDADNLYKYFGETHAVDGFSVHIPAGEIYGLVGSDGAARPQQFVCYVVHSKRTLAMRCICGYDVVKQTENARSQLGYLSQRFSLYEDLLCWRISASLRKYAA